MEKKVTKAPALIVGAAAITKAIISIQGRGAKLDGDIQTAGLSILAHIEEHGDTTLADRLYNAMPKGSRRLALAEWFLAYGSVSPVTDKALLKAGRVFQMDRDKVTDMAEARLKMWHEMKAQADTAVAEAFDVQKAFASLMARIRKAQVEGLRLDGIEGVRGMAAQLEALAPAKV